MARSTCERCGAPLAFVAGSAAAVCGACDATAVAGRTLQVDLAAAAERRAYDLELERVRAERQVYRASASSYGIARHAIFLPFARSIAVFSFAGIIGGLSALVSGIAQGTSSSRSRSTPMEART